MMNAEDTAFVAEVKERVAAATPGPWSVAPDYDEYNRELKYSFGVMPIIVEGMNKEDADFIANAPADLARLVALVEALDARLTVTPEKVERIAEAIYYAHRPDWRNLGGLYLWENRGTESREAYLREARAALLAAGMVDPTNSKPSQRYDPRERTSYEQQLRYEQDMEEQSEGVGDR
jgi:hypothetical protein